MCKKFYSQTNVSRIERTLRYFPDDWSYYSGEAGYKVNSYNLPGQKGRVLVVIFCSSCIHRCHPSEETVLSISSKSLANEVGQGGHLLDF